MRRTWVLVFFSLTACGQSSDWPGYYAGDASSDVSRADAEDAGTVGPSPTDSGTDVRQLPDAGADVRPPSDTGTDLPVPDASDAGGGEGGILTFPEPGFDTPQVAFGPGGRAHMVYTAGLMPGVLTYGTCAGACEAPGNWEFVVLFSDVEVDEARMGVDASGRVHLVYQQRSTGGDARTLYASCAGSCTAPERWSAVELTALIDWSQAAYRGAPLVVDPDGGVALLTSTLTVNARITLAICGGDCTTPENWVAGVVREGGSRMALAVNGAGLHMFFYDGANTIVYQTCSEGCLDAANWLQTGLFAHDGESNISVVSVGNELRVAYNQGRSYSAVQTIVDQDYRTLFWRCAGNCLDVANWSGTVLAGPGDGESLALAALGPVSVLAYETDELGLNVGVCASNCVDAASWESFTVDSTDAMNATLDPYSMLCDGSRPQFASWYVNNPVIALDPESGAGMFAHSGSNLRQCSVGGQFYSLYGLGRLIFVP